MITCVQLNDSDEIERLRDDYLHTLVAPMDGMWESGIIAQTTFWDVREQGHRVGHFCIAADNDMLRFHLTEDYLARAQEVFGWVISTYGIQGAIASTIEPLYFSLCLDVQRSVAVHSYLFRDGRPVEQSVNLSTDVFRRAQQSELGDLVRFYRAHTEGPGDWIEPFLSARLDREELFVLLDQQTVIATGECRPSQSQPPYADLGMVVAQSQRGRGLGSSMLMRLKRICYDTGRKPICSCEAANLASKRAIEKAGFISEHRMVRFLFSSLEGR